MKKLIVYSFMTLLSFSVSADSSMVDTIRALKKNSRDHAVIFITQDGCAYCEVQKRVNKEFARYTGWHIEEKRIEEHPSVRARFNVVGTPTLIVVKKGSRQWNPIGLGAIDLETMLTNSRNTVNHLAGKDNAGQIWSSGSATGVSIQ